MWVDGKLLSTSPEQKQQPSNPSTEPRSQPQATHLLNIVKYALTEIRGSTSFYQTICFIQKINISYIVFLVPNDRAGISESQSVILSCSQLHFQHLIGFLL